MQEPPIERIIFLPHRVNAHQIVGQNRPFECLSIFRPDAPNRGQVPRIRTHYEVLLGNLGRHRSRKLPERFPVLDIDVQVLCRIWIVM